MRSRCRTVTIGDSRRSNNVLSGNTSFATVADPLDPTTGDGIDVDIGADGNVLENNEALSNVSGPVAPCIK